MIPGLADGSSPPAPRRVLILVENLPVPFDRRVWQEAGALRDAGHEVTVISPAGPGYPRGAFDIEGIRVWRYALPFEGSGAAGYLLEYATALTASFALALRLSLTRGFDVIHACNPPDLFFLIGGFFRLFGKRFVFDHHDLCPELYEAKFGRRGRLYRALRVLERLSFRTADIAIATNESYRRLAIERGGMSPSRVFVVRSGPSLERMRMLPPDPRLLRGRRYLVGYVGVIGPQEGLDVLLGIAHHVVHVLRRTDVQFIVVGGGTALAEVKALAGRLQVAAHVTFTGRVPDEELLTALCTADVCVDPGPNSEMNDLSTMNKIMEYMALARPIVQFDLREGRQSALQASLYARCNDTADFAEKLVGLLDDPARRAEMAEFGRRRVLNELAWEHQAPRLVAAYSTLWCTGSVSAHETPAA